MAVLTLEFSDAIPISRGKSNLKTAGHPLDADVSSKSPRTLFLDTASRCLASFGLQRKRASLQMAVPLPYSAHPGAPKV
jgi:hypothetical protein